MKNLLALFILIFSVSAFSQKLGQIYSGALSGFMNGYVKTTVVSSATCGKIMKSNKSLSEVEKLLFDNKVEEFEKIAGFSPVNLNKVQKQKFLKFLKTAKKNNNSSPCKEFQKLVDRDNSNEAYKDNCKSLKKAIEGDCELTLPRKAIKRVAVLFKKTIKKTIKKKKRNEKTEANTAINIEPSEKCETKIQKNNVFAEHCQEVPAHLNTDKSQNVFSALQAIMLTNSRDVLSIQGKSTDCDNCLRKINRATSNTNLDESIGQLKVDLSKLVQDKRMELEVSRLAKKMEILMDLESTRESLSSSSQESGCYSEKNLKEKIEFECEKTGVKSELAYELFKKQTEKRGASSLKNPLEALKEQISFRETDLCKQKGKSSRKEYQKFLTEGYYDEKSPYYSNLKAITSLFDSKLSEKNIYVSACEEGESFSPRELMFHDEKELSSLDAVSRGEPYLKILMNDSGAFCKYLELEIPRLDDFLVLNERNKDIGLKKQGKVLNEYTKSCERSFEQIAKLSCSDHKKEDFRKNLSRAQTEQILSDYVDSQLSKKASGANSSKLLSAGSLSCSNDHRSFQEEGEPIDIYEEYLSGKKNTLSGLTHEKIRGFINEKKESHYIGIELPEKEILKKVGFHSLSDDKYCNESTYSFKNQVELKKILYGIEPTSEEREAIRLAEVQSLHESGKFVVVDQEVYEAVKSNKGISSVRHKKEKVAAKSRVVDSDRKSGELVNSGNHFTALNNKDEQRVPQDFNKTLGQYANNLSNTNYQQNYMDDIKVANEVDSLINGTNSDGLNTTPLSNNDFIKQMADLEQRRKDLEKRQEELDEKSNQLDKLSQKQELDDLNAERKNLEDEFEKLKKEETQILANHKRQKGKVAAKKKIERGIASVNSAPVQPVDKVNSALGRTKEVKKYLAQNPVVRQGLSSALTTINTNPELNIQVQAPLSHSEFIKIMKTATPSDFNIKYDGQGKPWLVQIAGETQYFDLNFMTDEDRERIFDILKLEKGDRVAEVTSILEEIDRNIINKQKRDSSIDPALMKLEGLNALLKAAINDEDKGLVTALFHQIKKVHK